MLCAAGRWGRSSIKLGHARNASGVAGMVAFAEAVRSGSMGSLVELYLSRNAIGDAGLTALATAIGSGSLPNLKDLVRLSDNLIGDAGVTTIAGAIASGMLASIELLDLDFNNATETGKKQIRDVAQARGFKVTAVGSAAPRRT